MKRVSRRLTAVAATLIPGLACATNGMNLEGYGPIATGMGGAAMAYDNGTAAMANNAATLGLMNEGSRLDLALGSLSPNVSSAAYPQKSKATQFLMPAAGWAKRQGKWVYGAGVFSQGGMGTEYDITLPDGSAGIDRSEVGVGRFIVPIVYRMSDTLILGGSVDYVWATMDLQMTTPGSQLGPMVAGGTLAASLPSLMTANTYGRFDFSDGSDFSGKAKGSGFATKLGMTYVFSKALTVGFNYQSKTALSDLNTSGSGATVTFYQVNTPQGVADMALTGKVTVKDFQWPETFALGMSYHATDDLMIVADVKRIQWSGVMKSFNMTFTADATSAAALGGGTQTLDVVMAQNWKDQTVVQVGAAYKFSPALTGRAGINSSSNPVPDQDVNPLFPAIIKSHYTVGLGYDFSKANAVNFSFTYAPEVKVTNPTSGEITHSQNNWQLMYSHFF